MTDIGPHLLGRIPSPPDERDFRAARFLLDDAATAQLAIDELKKTTVGYDYWAKRGGPKPTSHWFKALALLAQIAPPTPSANVVWDNPEAVLDQGNYGTCVGNGFAQFGNTLPFDDKFTEVDARAIYYEATKLDGSPDDPDAPGGGQQGATVRSGAKAMQARGRIDGYAFAANLAEVLNWLHDKGPVVFGSNWTNDMFTPDANGYVAPTGSVAGGHCYVAVGNLYDEQAVEFLNSWSADWALDGYFKMKYADVEKLLADNGEAVVALELP